MSDPIKSEVRNGISDIFIISVFGTNVFSDGKTTTLADLELKYELSYAIEPGHRIHYENLLELVYLCSELENQYGVPLEVVFQVHFSSLSVSFTYIMIR